MRLPPAQFGTGDHYDGDDNHNNGRLFHDAPPGAA